MSALTDASGDNGIPRDAIKAPRRDRTVSWDQNFFDNSEMESTLPTTILQPILQDEALSINDGSKSIARGNRNRTRTLDLADIKADNPMETEAETAIIAAIEEENRIEGGRQRSDSASILMPHVPDEGLDMFEESNSAKSSVKPTSSQESSIHSQEQASPRAKSRHRRNKPTLPTEGLKREDSDTLENTLSGLATAMRKIHTETSEQVDRSEINRSHRRLPSRDIGHPAALMEDIPVNNADVLVHNANRLLRRNVQKDDSSIGDESSNEPEERRAQESQDRTMKHIWNIFETKPDPKKTDGDRLDQVEEGSVESASDDSSNRSDYGSTEAHPGAQVVAGDIEEGNNEYNENDKENSQRPTDDPEDQPKKTPLRGAPRVLRQHAKKSEARLGNIFGVSATKERFNSCVLQIDTFASRISIRSRGYSVLLGRESAGGQERSIHILDPYVHCSSDCDVRNDTMHSITGCRLPMSQDEVFGATVRPDNIVIHRAKQRTSFHHVDMGDLRLCNAKRSTRSREPLVVLARVY